jgi:outer membrane scaffolding protein for murein synthesis (MipA/OmpV family)
VKLTSPKHINLPLLSTFLLIHLLIASDSYAQENPDINETPDRSLTGFESLDDAQPLWEFGAGGGLIDVANYPASSERNFIALAAPYVVYKGDVFRLGGGGGARAVVVEDKNYEIDLSFGGAFSADSDDNTAREGMPELDFLFEIGPQLVYRVKDFKFENGGNGRLNFRLQARAVFSTDFEDIEDRGYVFEPRLTYQQRGVWQENTGLNLSASLIFASEDLHDYFYQVDSEFVTDSRAQFDAKGGFLGAELGASMSFPITKNIRGFASLAAQIHHGAANEDSPLFEDDITYSVGLGFVWRLYQSEAKANW